MKKLFSSLVMIASCVCAHGATITTNPSPAVTTKPVEVTVTGVDFGSDAYCYTWCIFSQGSGIVEKPACDWNNTNVPKYQMTQSNGGYTYKITNIKEFYSLTDAELGQLAQIGFIVKNNSGGQTDDLKFNVVQGRRDAYSGGEGTSASPFILKTAADLATLSTTTEDWGAEVYLKMEADIDASALSSTIGTKSSPFSAHFDGNGHSVTGLNLQSTKLGTATGLFGIVNGGTISNLGVVNGSVEGTTYVGLLAGYLESGTIERCFATGVVSGTSICVGGLVGENLHGTIENCYSGVEVENSADYATGGLVGKNSGVIKNTYTGGEVTGHDYVGGLVGANYGNVSNSAALNKIISAPHDFVARFGGNNNTRNQGSNNLSWEEMGTGRETWAQHGDHAAATSNKILKNKAKFEELTGWDFENIWEWKTDMNNEYPALRNLANQRTPLSDEYYIESTGISGVRADGSISVWPNPTTGPVNVNSANGIADYALYSLDGSVVANGSAAGSAEVTLDCGSLRSGLYLLTVNSSNGEQRVFKIVKK